MLVLLCVVFFDPSLSVISYATILSLWHCFNSCQSHIDLPCLQAMETFSLLAFHCSP